MNKWPWKHCNGITFDRDAAGRGSQGGTQREGTQQGGTQCEQQESRRKEG